MPNDHRYKASMDAAALPAETAPVQQLLDELDLNIQIRSDHADRGVMETLPWTLTIAVPAMTFLKAFMKRFGERTGDTAGDAVDAAARALHRWILRLHESRQGRQCFLILTDRTRGLDIVIPRDLSTEAYRQLTELLETLPERDANRPCELRWTGDRWMREPL